MSAPRFAYVCADPGVPVFGTKGSSVHVQSVLRPLRERAPVDLFALASGGPPPSGLDGVLAVELGRPGGAPAERERGLQRLDDDLLAALLDHGPYSLVYERFSLWATAGVRAARSWGVPSVLEVNSPLLEEQAAHRSLVDASAAQERAALSLSAASVVVAVSDPVRDWALSLGADPARTHVVRNGVDVSRFPSAPRGRTVPGFVVGFVGTLKPWHGLPTLLEAFAAAAEPSWRLLVVGDGPERPALESLAKDLGIRDQLELTGAVAPAAVPALLSRMDVGTAPYPPGSEYFSPLKVYEYMAACVPVVASATGQVASVATDGLDALLVEPGSSAALAAALTRLAADEPLRLRLASAGRRLAEGHTWDRVVDHVLDLAGGVR